MPDLLLLFRNWGDKRTRKWEINSGVDFFLRLWDSATLLSIPAPTHPYEVKPWSPLDDIRSINIIPLNPLCRVVMRANWNIPMTTGLSPCGVGWITMIYIFKDQTSWIILWCCICYWNTHLLDFCQLIRKLIKTECQTCFTHGIPSFCHFLKSYRVSSPKEFRYYVICNKIV